jgi:hypothetical protein
MLERVWSFAYYQQTRNSTSITMFLWMWTQVNSLIPLRDFTHTHHVFIGLGFMFMKEFKMTWCISFVEGKGGSPPRDRDRERSIPLFRNICRPTYAPI